MIRSAATINLLRTPLTPCWLLIALLPFGRSAELSTFLCAVGAVLLVRRDGAEAWRNQGWRLLWPLLGCYIAAAFFSAFTAVKPEKSWTTVLALLRYLPLGLYICAVMRGAQRLRGFYFAIAIVIACWVLDAWMQMLTGWSLRGQAGPERISGLFGADDPKLGPTLAVLSPLFLWAAHARWGVRGLIVAFLLVLGPVMLSGSRAAWVCYALVAVLFAWREAGSPWRFISACALGSILLLAAGGIAWKTSPRFDARMQRTLAALGGHEADLNQATTGRIDIWRTSLRMLAAHPVTGVGVRDFRYAYPQFAPDGDHFLTAENCGEGEGACHAHQLLLEILTETGTVGLACWIAGGLIALRAWRRASASNRAAAFPVAVSLVVMLFPFNTHLAFYSAWWGLLFAWLLGLWCAALYATERASCDGT